jgi:hypothetical protein
MTKGFIEWPPEDFDEEAAAFLTPTSDLGRGMVLDLVAIGAGNKKSGR